MVRHIWNFDNLICNTKHVPEGFEFQELKYLTSPLSYLSRASLASNAALMVFYLIYGCNSHYLHKHCLNNHGYCLFGLNATEFYLCA